MNDKFTGLLGDPMLQIGLGILANNTGNRGAFAPAFGRGVMQGMNNAQDFAQQQQMLGFRNQQADMQRQQFDLQKQVAEREKQQFDFQEKAIQDASKNNPELAGLFRLNPAAAIKATFPNANGADPYYTPIATENGLGTFNNRTGQFTPLNVNGKPIIKSTDSPALQGQISASKSYGENLYQPTDMQSGVIKNKSQLAIDAGAPMPSGYPSVSPKMQAQRDVKKTQILQGELASEKRAMFSAKTPEERATHQRNIELISAELGIGSSGVKVPTKAEEAGAVAKASAEAKAQVDLSTDKTKNVRTADKFLSAAQEAEKLLDKDPTGSGVGALADSVGRAVGYSSDSSQVASQLETLSGWMVSNVPRMEGPQSNYDVENYKTMAGMVGNRTVPVAERKAALKEVIKLQEKYKSLNGGGSAPKATAKGKFSITAPNGKEYSFGSQNELNNFKMKANIR